MRSLPTCSFSPFCPTANSIMPRAWHSGRALERRGLPRYARAETRAPPMTASIVTAALMVIGDEILSGRTKDKNIGTVADTCTAVGIDLKEVRVVPDEEAEIVAALN